MTDEQKLESLPMGGGWASKQPSPGATTDAPAPDCWGSKNAESLGATETIEGQGAQRAANFGALLSAFIASSWCWLPPLLILGGISGAGITTFMAEYRPIFLAVTIAFLVAAFYLTYRPRASMSGSKIVAMNKIMLWAVTIMVAVFLFFPQVATSFFEPGGDKLTPDMQQTTIMIEGMTWHSWAPKAEKAIKSAPGVLAVKIEYEKRQAIIGTAIGEDVPRAEILAALKKIRYTGTFADE